MSKPTIKSATVPTIKKEPFQKVRSRLERNKIYEQIPRTVDHIMCKGDGDYLFKFKPVDFDPKEGVIGKVTESEGKIKNGEVVIANFQVAEEKYFVQTSLWVYPDKEVLGHTEDLYLMQRRAYVRIDLTSGKKRLINIISQNGKAVFAAGECLDISAGGSRIVLNTDKLQVSQGEHLKVVFHIRGKWEFEAVGVVKHVRTNAEGFLEFGFEFDRTVRALVSKLDLMMLELQKLTFLDGI